MQLLGTGFRWWITWSESISAISNQELFCLQSSSECHHQCHTTKCHHWHWHWCHVLGLCIEWRRIDIGIVQWLPFVERYICGLWTQVENAEVSYSAGAVFFASRPLFGILVTLLFSGPWAPVANNGPRKGSLKCETWPSIWSRIRWDFAAPAWNGWGLCLRTESKSSVFVLGIIQMCLNHGLSQLHCCLWIHLHHVVGWAAEGSTSYKMAFIILHAPQ